MRRGNMKRQKRRKGTEKNERIKTTRESNSGRVRTRRVNTEIKRINLFFEVFFFSETKRLKTKETIYLHEKDKKGKIEDHAWKKQIKSKKLSKSRTQGFFPRVIFLTKINDIFWKLCPKTTTIFWRDPKRRQIERKSRKVISRTAQKSPKHGTDKE